MGKSAWLLVATAAVLLACARPSPRPAAPPLLAAHAPPAPETAAPEPVAAPRVDFTRDLRPLLESRCTPCHFAGGKMYDRLPFDRPETLRLLGDKLFTRIKEPEEQALLRTFLAQPATASEPGS